MRIEGQYLVLVLLDKQGQRIVDLRGIDVTVPSSAGIASVGVGRVLCSSRIEEFLFVEDVVVALAAAHHAEVDGQMVVEGQLRHVELGCEIAVAIVRDHRVLAHVGQRGTVLLLVAAATECDVMVLCKARTSQGSLEVGVVAAIHIGLVQLSRRSHILVGIEHVELLVGCFEADVAVVRDMELRTLPLLGGHHNHTRSTLRAVGRCLGCILEDGEALDVGRIDTREGRKVAIDAIDDYQGFVTTGQRRGSTQTHAVQHRHAVGTRCLHIQACCLSRKRLQGIGHQASVHPLLVDDYGRTANIVCTVVSQNKTLILCLQPGRDNQ